MIQHDFIAYRGKRGHIELQTASAGIHITSLILMIFAGCGPDETPSELPLIEYKLVITD